MTPGACVPRPAGGSTVGGRMKVSLMDALGGNGKTGAARHTMLVDPTHTALAVAAAARNVRGEPSRLPADGCDLMLR